MRSRSELASAHRIVVKLGTGVVTRNGIDLALGRIHAIVEDLGSIVHAGRSIVLVSSGAVGMGLRALGRTERPTSLGLRQACAAIGQGKLIALYGQAFAALGLTAAQVLLTQEDLGDADRALCLRTTLTRLLELGTIPVLNENDSVSVRELVEHAVATGSEPPSGSVAFGDNDGLSARVALGLDADLLVLVTDVDGVFTGNPRSDPEARRRPELHGVDADALAGAAGQSAGGTGGMRSKLEAAQLCAQGGTTVAVVGGDHPRAVTRLLAGEDIGTVVWPTVPRKARRQSIAHGRDHRGALVVNEGALAALRGRKASLLPVGVEAVEGRFSRGDVVEIRDGSGRVHGRGIVNYDASQCATLAGHRSQRMEQLIGFRGYDALVTRDNLVLTTT